MALRLALEQPGLALRAPDLRGAVLLGMEIDHEMALVALDLERAHSLDAGAVQPVCAAADPGEPLPARARDGRAGRRCGSVGVPASGSPSVAPRGTTASVPT